MVLEKIKEPISLSVYARQKRVQKCNSKNFKLLKLSQELLSMVYCSNVKKTIKYTNA